MNILSAVGITLLVITVVVGGILGSSRELLRIEFPKLMKPDEGDDESGE